MHITKSNRYGAPNTLDRIKFIALIIMTIDHIGDFIFPDVPELRAIGRITMPVWFFLVGYYTANMPTGSWQSYTKKWSVYFIYTALMLLADFVTSHSILPLAALFSMFACQAMLLLPYVRRNLTEKSLQIQIILLFVLLPTMMLFEYGSQGLLFAVVGYLVRIKQWRWETRATAIVAYLLFCTLQNTSFEYSSAWQCFVIIGTAIVVYHLMRIEKKEWGFAIKNPLFGFIACYLSRNSLHYYFIHFVVIQLLGAWINPPAAYFVFKLL